MSDRGFRFTGRWLRLLPPRPTGTVGQAPSDPNREVWVCPPNLRNRTHAIAPATAGQMAGAPARAAKSPSISAVTTTANAIMGASRMRAATTVADVQFRILVIAPSLTPSLLTLPTQMSAVGRPL